MLKKEQNEREEEAQQTLNHLVRPPTRYSDRHPKQLAAHGALVDFIANDLMPLSLVESTTFRKFVGILDPQYHLPSRKYLSEVMLEKKFTNLKTEVQNKLKKAPSLNLTADLWSSRQMRSFLGVTGQYISEDWQLESFVLGCNRVIGRHTADNVALWYEELVADFQVAQKVRHIITDSAANMKRAFTTLPGFEDDLSPNAEEEEDLDDFDLTPEANYQSPFQDFLPFDHHSCFAHSIQLVVKDGMTKAGQIGTVIRKCSKLVAFVRRSTVATDELRGENRPQSDNITRWNSQLKMIRSVLAIDEQKLLQLKDAPKVTTHERNVLHDVVDILSPFEEATDLVQIDKIPSAGYVLPCIRGLNHHMQNTVSKYNSSFVSALKLSLKKRMPYYEEIESYQLAAVLDPRFKLSWANDEEKEPLISLLKATITKMERRTLRSTNEQPTQQEEQNNEPPAKKTKTLFSFIDMPSQSQSDANKSTSEELDAYLQSERVSMTTNPLQFWKENESRYSSLAKIAREVLGVPSSSAAVERLFSTAGKIFSPERCRLTDNRFEQLMFIRCNNCH